MECERGQSQLQRRMDATYIDKLDGKITDDFWQRKQAKRNKDELRIESLISGSRREPERRKTAHHAKDFRTRAKCSFSLPYAKTGGTGRIVEKRTIELLD